MSDDNKLFPQFATKLFVTEQDGKKIYDYYLSGVIERSEDHIDFMQTLRTMSPYDSIIIHLNCYGGDVSTGNQILAAMNSCEGHIVAELEGAAYSMATYIFLNAHDWIVHEGSSYMAHTSTMGFYAKECDFHAYAEYNRKDVQKRVMEFYKNFHTEGEMQKILNNIDVWLDSETVANRLEQYKQARLDEQEAFEKEMGIEQPPCLDDVIEEAVDKGVSKAIDKILKRYKLVEKEPKPPVVKTKA